MADKDVDRETVPVNGAPGHMLLATASPDLQQRMYAAAQGLVPLKSLPFPSSPTALVSFVAGTGVPDVVVLDPGPGGAMRGLEVASRLDQQFPGLNIVLVSDLGPDISLPAMRAGVRDVLHPAAPVADIKSTLDRAVQAADRSRPLRQAAAATMPFTGRVISVVSPKGGVGKTTVATNLAVGLAEFDPSSTVLVDLDLQFGDVASALDLKPEQTLPDAVRSTAGPDTMLLKTYLTQHSTGMYVLCGSDSPADADRITAQQVGHLLQLLASEFRYVIVDTAPGLSEHTLSAMDQSSDLVLVTSLDVPGIRGLRKELMMLSALNMVPDARHVVLNFADRNSELSITDVEATLGAAVDFRIPRSKAIVASTNQGVPLLQNPGRDKSAKQLRQLVDRFAPPPPPAPRRHQGRHYSRGQAR